jgi:hypothetical protein
MCFCVEVRRTFSNLPCGNFASYIFIPIPGPLLKQRE